MHTPREITIEEFDQIANMLKGQTPDIDESDIREELLKDAIVVFDHYALPTEDFSEKICIVLGDIIGDLPMLIGWKDGKAIEIEWG